MVIPRTTTIAMALVLASTSGCILLYEEVGGGGQGGSSNGGAGGTVSAGGQASGGDDNGGGGSNVGGSGGDGGEGGGGTCVPPVQVNVVNMMCPGSAVAVEGSSIFVVRGAGCPDSPAASATIGHYTGLVAPEFVNAAQVPLATGLGLAARDADNVFYAPQGGEILDIGDGESISAQCPGCNAYWGGIVAVGGAYYISVQNKANGAVYEFDALGTFIPKSDPDTTDELGYEVDAIRHTATETSLAWTTLTGDLATGTIHRSSTIFGYASGTATLGPPSGIALDEDGTIYVRVAAGSSAELSKLYKWVPDSEEPDPYPVEIVAPLRSLVALDRKRQILYANGFVSGQAGPQTVYRCACDDCSPAPVACDTISDIAVDDETGVAVFTCGNQLVTW
ncbi:MAG: hypothetical protein HOW73_44455 [Polyangiaceae bacterium]|nr:hypothetical protein [Polyangiaceae bacterium]